MLNAYISLDKAKTRAGLRFEELISCKFLYVDDSFRLIVLY